MTAAATAAADDAATADGDDAAAAAVGGGRGAVGGGGPSPPAAASSASRPRRLAGLPPITAIAAGFAHTLLAAAPAAGGGIWACGWDGDGQLGLGRRPRGAAADAAAAGADAGAGGTAAAADDCVTAPTLVPASAGVGVARLAAGRIHSAAVTDDGRLFTWGGGLHGRLGLDDFASMSEPCEVQFFADEGLRVLDIACGLDHTLVLAEELP